MTTSDSSSVPRGSVLVGVDGSGHSDAAVAWAVDHARARHAPLVVVHAAGPIGVEWIPFADEGRQMLLPSSHRITDHALDLVRAQAPDLAVSVVRSFDDPRQVLIEVAESAAMLVVGTRGHGPVRSLLLGSVSHAVAGHAPCPVTVVRPAQLRGGPRQGHVVVGVDLDASSRSPLELAFELAEEMGRPLDVVHAWFTHDTFVEATSQLQRHDILDRRECRLAELVADCAEKYPGVTVARRIVGASPVAALLELSQTAGHLVLGSRGRHGVSALLGTVSRSLVERAHCPVTVVRDPAVAHREELGR